MKQAWAAFAVGFIFAIGLGVSGMTQPEKVQGFLDVFGHWDPSLMFVMIGAIGLHTLTYRWIRKRSSPLFSGRWHVPTKKDLTPALMIGSMLFGIGWGLAGYCPGPAVTSLAGFNFQAWLFVGAMLVGMLIFKVLDAKLKLQK
jgi:uncharacterized membrane protein YedE/YeeE